MSKQVTLFYMQSIRYIFIFMNTVISHSLTNIEYIFTCRVTGIYIIVLLHVSTISTKNICFYLCILSRVYLHMSIYICNTFGVVYDCLKSAPVYASIHVSVYIKRILIILKTKHYYHE